MLPYLSHKEMSIFIPRKPTNSTFIVGQSRKVSLLQTKQSRHRLNIKRLLALEKILDLFIKLTLQLTYLMPFLKNRLSLTKNPFKVAQFIAPWRYGIHKPSKISEMRIYFSDLVLLHIILNFKRLSERIFCSLSNNAEVRN